MRYLLPKTRINRCKRVDYSAIVPRSSFNDAVILNVNVLANVNLPGSFPAIVPSPKPHVVLRCEIFDGNACAYPSVLSDSDPAWTREPATLADRDVVTNRDRQPGNAITQLLILLRAV